MSFPMNRTLFNSFNSISNLTLNYLVKYSSSLPLKDNFGRKHDYLRISLTEKCNLRCVYCMPEAGVTLSPKSSLLQRDEINRLAKLFVRSLGVKKIKLTGGEPLVRSDCISIVNDLASLKSDGLSTIGITTNGLVLGRSIKKLIDSGLDSVNISLDTLRPEKFEFITRRKGFNCVIKSIEQCLSADLPKIVKINCVIMRGLNDDEIISFVQLTSDQQLEVRFIEYMPFDGNKWSQGKMVPAHEIMKIIKTNYGDDKIKPISKDDPSDTATLFSIEGFKGRFGFIGSMTQNFCSSCNRLRIAADGNIKVCLFGSEEVSLRDPLRAGWADQQIINLIQSALSRKRERHAGAINISKSTNRPMILIAHRMFSTYRTINNDNQNDVNDDQQSDKLSHINEKGSAEMVDISGKQETRRIAQAMGIILIGPQVIKLIVNNEITKGDVLSTARIAGIFAAKSTSNLIPLCHPLQLTKVTINFDFIDDQMIQVNCIVSTISRTGVEMEALTGVSIATLTIYDMCKSVNKSMIIKEIKLIKKTGGESDYQRLIKD